MEKNIYFELGYDIVEEDSFESIIDEEELKEEELKEKDAEEDGVLITTDIEDDFYYFIYQKSLDFIKNHITDKYRFKPIHEKILYHIISKMRYIDENPQKIKYKEILTANLKNRFSVGYQFPREFMYLVQKEIGLVHNIIDEFDKILKFSGLFTQYFSNYRGYCSGDITQCRQFLFNYSLICGIEKTRRSKYFKNITREYRRNVAIAIDQYVYETGLEGTIAFQYLAYNELLDDNNKPIMSIENLRKNPLKIIKNTANRKKLLADLKKIA